MKDNKKFIGIWEKQRQKGKLQYVSKYTGVVVASGLCGTIFGSVFLYNSPSSYSFMMYLPTYFLVSFAGFFGGILISMYKWRKNEERYSESLD